MLSTLFLINTATQDSPLRGHPADAPHVLHSGRVATSEAGHVSLGYSGTRIRFAFHGQSCALRLRSVGAENWVEVLVDGARVGKHPVSKDWQTIEILRTPAAATHTVELVKVTEGYEGNVEVAGILLDDSAELLPWPTPETRQIEFIGDSITCGYGIEANDPNETWTPSTQNFCDTYAWITSKALNANYLVVARSGIGMLRNYDGAWAGDSENLPFLYERTFFHHQEPRWDFSRFRPDVVCINLGTNDFSTTGVDASAWESAYWSFVQRLLTHYPQSKLVCLLGPMLNSPEVKEILSRVVVAANRDLPHPQVHLLELSPQGSLGYGADWHPSKAQAQRNAAELTAYLRELMDWF